MNWFTLWWNNQRNRQTIYVFLSLLFIIILSVWSSHQVISYPRRLVNKMRELSQYAYKNYKQSLKDTQPAQQLYHTMEAKYTAHFINDTVFDDTTMKKITSIDWNAFIKTIDAQWSYIVKQLGARYPEFQFY